MSEFNYGGMVCEKCGAHRVYHTLYGLECKWCDHQSISSDKIGPLHFIGTSVFGHVFETDDLPLYDISDISNYHNISYWGGGLLCRYVLNKRPDSFSPYSSDLRRVVLRRIDVATNSVVDYRVLKYLTYLDDVDSVQITLDLVVGTRCVVEVQTLLFPKPGELYFKWETHKHNLLKEVL